MYTEWLICWIRLQKKSWNKMTNLYFYRRSPAASQIRTQFYFYTWSRSKISKMCGGFKFSKNALVVLNILYIVSSWLNPKILYFNGVTSFVCSWLVSSWLALLHTQKQRVWLPVCPLLVESLPVVFSCWLFQLWDWLVPSNTIKFFFSS